MEEHGTAVIAVEACGSANFWSREIIKLGHKAYLIPFAPAGRHGDAKDCLIVV